MFLPLDLQISIASLSISPSLPPVKTLPKRFHFISCTSPFLIAMWACSRCTFMNPPTQKSKCEVCLSPAPPPSSSLSSPSASSSSPPRWACKACTFLNSYSRSNCEVCDTRASLSSFDDLNPTNLDEVDGLEASVGSVFFPLRRCSKGKELDPEPVSESGDLGYERNFSKPADSSSPSERGGFRGVKSSRKEGKAEDDDGFSMKNVLESVESNKELSSIKILSYNVWFREDLEMQERMEAIGDLIHLHSPDIICLQEVTPDIYDTFQKSSWWRIYQCSVSRERAHSRAYFCMLLAKLPIKSFSNKPFSNTMMGRELCIAEVEVKPDKSLVVATSHLESPCPGPPKWDQMYSKERVDQAKESINFLKKYPNVVFGGDMNWDDKLDGQFPFPENWVDAWANLRPTEKGYTYDTKSNKMLSGNRSLQKRLDRFICNLQDFKISGIDMVGMEEIPGLSYCKEKKGKNGIQKLTLPVLPSDHYGLLLTITKL